MGRERRFVIWASGIYMIGRALVALLTVASIALFSRVLAPSDYGVYTLTVTTSALFNALFCTWVIQSVFRTYAETPDRVRLQSTGIFALILSAIVSTLTALTVMLLSGSPITVELAIGILMLLTGYSVYEYSNVQITLQRRPLLFVQLQLAKLLCTFALPLTAFLLSQRFDHFMLALGFAYWLPLLRPRFLTWAEGVRLRHVDRAIMGHLARYGLPLSSSILLVQLGTSLDRYILGAMKGVDAVAGYAAGADLALFSLGMMAAALSQAFYPKLLELRAAQRNDEERQLYSQYIRLFIGLLLPSAVGLYFVADDLAWMIMGTEIRADAAVSLGLFSATALFINLKSCVVDLRYQIAKRTFLPIVNAGSMIGLLVAGCFLLVPSYGGTGAAWASLIAATGGCTIAALVSTGLPGRVLLPLADLSKIVAAVAIMATILYGIDQWFYSTTGWSVVLVRLAAQIFIGMVVYGATLVVMNFPPARQALIRVSTLRALGRPR